MTTKPKRIRKTGTLDDARRELWRAVVCSRTVLMAPESGDELTLKAAHCVQQCVSAYVRLLETSTMQGQLDTLKTELLELRQSAGLRKAA